MTAIRRVEAESKAFEIVKSCGFDGILTSGGPGNAPDNAERLAGIVGLTSRGIEDDRVEIIIGGGVRSVNISALMARLTDNKGNGNIWFHSSCLSMRDGTVLPTSSFQTGPSGTFSSSAISAPYPFSNSSTVAGPTGTSPVHSGSITAPVGTGLSTSLVPVGPVAALELLSG